MIGAAGWGPPQKRDHRPAGDRAAGFLENTNNSDGRQNNDSVKSHRDGR
jgi:hypothetical protein